MKENNNVENQFTFTIIKSIKDADRKWILNKINKQTKHFSIGLSLNLFWFEIFCAKIFIVIQWCKSYFHLSIDLYLLIFVIYLLNEKFFWFDSLILECSFWFKWWWCHFFLSFISQFIIASKQTKHLAILSDLNGFSFWIIVSQFGSG